MKQAMFRLLALVCVVLVMGCASDREKTEKFLGEGQASFDAGEYNQAVIQIKNAIELTPKSLEAHRLLAKTYLKLGDARAAFNTLLKIEQLDPQDLDNVAQVASFYLLGRQTDQAQKRVDQILTKAPEHLQALYLSAGLLSENPDNLDKIKTIYNKILSIDPDQARANLALARISAAESRFEQAEQYLKKALAIAPDNINIYKTLFEFYMARKEPGKGQKVLEDLIKQKPDQADPYIFMGNFHLGMNQPDQAEAAFKTAIEKDNANVNAHMLLARLLNTRGDARAAETYIQKAVALDPDNFTVKTAYAEFQFSHNQMEKAGQIIDEILGKRPDFIPAKVLSGKIMIRKKEYDNAIHLFTDLTRDEPDSPAYHFLLGSALFEKGDLSQAKAALSKALEKGPGHIQARVLLAGIHLRQKDYDLAKDNITLVLKQAPNLYRANLILGNILMAQGENSQARQTFEKMTASAPKNPAAYYRLGILDRAEKKYAAAEKHLLKALELNPTLMDVFSALVSIYAVAGDYDKALTAIDTHMEKTGSNPVVAAILLNLRGNILLSKKDKTGAEADFKSAMEKNPKYLSPYMTLAKLYAAEKKWEATEKVYQDLIKNRPDQALAHGLLGSLYEKTGKPDQAEVQYLKALELDPNHIPAVNNLAYLYAEQDRELNKALDLARQAKERLGRIPAIMDTLGWVYYKKGLYDSAVQEFESCIQLLPKNPVFHYHLGLALHKLGKSDQAKASLEKALDLSKDFNGALDARSILESI